MYHIYEIRRDDSWKEDQYHVDFFRSSDIGFSPDQNTTFTSASAMWNTFKSDGYQLFNPDTNDILLNR